VAKGSKKSRRTIRVVNEAELKELAIYFRSLDDSRSHINQRHKLINVVLISMCAVIAGADGPTAIELWAEANEDWLAEQLGEDCAVPSHDTIGRVLQSLRPDAFQECFEAWIESMNDIVDEPSEMQTHRDHVAVDGKTLRRSHDLGANLGPLHVVSAWATERGMAMGQQAADEKSNEITAIPELLKRINVSGSIVSIDAMGCQKAIARQLITNEADYVFGLKGNQGKIHEAVKTYVEDHMSDDFARIKARHYEENETGHGREDRRTYYQLPVPPDLEGAQGWIGLRTIGVAIRNTVTKGHESFDVRYFISSLRMGVKQLARVIRKHWSIESMHWVMDMTFREDESRIRHRQAADNLAWLRRFAMSLYKQHPGKQSLVMKRRMCGWSPDFLTQVLIGKAS
jgi:predicted transposase YbfD/YdcC